MLSSPEIIFYRIVWVREHNIKVKYSSMYSSFLTEAQAKDIVDNFVRYSIYSFTPIMVPTNNPEVECSSCHNIIFEPPIHICEVTNV